MIKYLYWNRYPHSTAHVRFGLFSFEAIIAKLFEKKFRRCSAKRIVPVTRVLFVVNCRQVLNGEFNTMEQRANGLMEFVFASTIGIWQFVVIETSN